MIRQTSALVLLTFISLSVAATPEENDSRLKDLESRFAAAMKKTGVSIGGSFNSQFMTSKAKGDSVVDANRHATENVEYTSVDFDLVARPHQAIGGHLVFRMHTDWRNLFSVYSSPIMSRWISIDGGAKDIFTFNVGDYRLKYSPLTVWSPDLAVDNEPRIFADRRDAAEGELFIGGNDRMFSGVNLGLGMQFAKDGKTVVEGLSVNLAAARLRVEAGSSDKWLSIAWANELASYDKYLIAPNIDLEVIPQIGVGATFMSTFDWLSTYAGSRINAELNAQRTFLIAGRGQVGTARFVNPEKFNVLLKGEFAQSIDYDSGYKVIDTTLHDTTVEHRKLVAPALNIDLAATLHPSPLLEFSLNSKFIRIDSDFRNDIAQSPTFLKRRIINTDNDMKDDWRKGSLYSTFDALYRHVFNFAPIQDADGASYWRKEPMEKIAYTRGIVTKEERAEILSLGLIDTVVGLIMPFGPATPNRQGITADLSAGIKNKAVVASVKVGVLGEIKSFDTLLNKATILLPDSLKVHEIAPKTSFMNVGGGLSVDLNKFGILPYTCEIGGGYELSTATRVAAAGWDKSTTTVGMLNAGLYWQFVKKLALLGGFQQARTKVVGRLYADTAAGSYTRTQSNVAAGLQYIIKDAGALTATVGRVSSKLTGDTLATGGKDPAQFGFKQNQIDLFLTVKF